MFQESSSGHRVLLVTNCVGQAQYTLAWKSIREQFLSEYAKMCWYCVRYGIVPI